MSRIDFDENGRSYIEIKEKEGEISIILSAEDADNPRNSIINSVNLTKEQFLSLISEIL